MNTNEEGLHVSPEGTITATGSEAVALFRITVVASGAALYLNTGLKPNRMYTPTRMRDVLNEATGSNAKSLVKALAAYVDALDAAGHPCTNDTVLRAVQGYATSTKGMTK